MNFRNALTLLLVTICRSSSIQTRQRYRFGDTCWPNEQTWQAFNQSISGRLVRTFPSAAVCHGPTFDFEECNEAKEEWFNSFWRTNQTGAYTAIAWELGDQECFINSSQKSPCQPGLGKEGTSEYLELRAKKSMSPALFCCRKVRRGYPTCSQVCKCTRPIPGCQKYGPRSVEFLSRIYLQVAADSAHSLGRSSGQGALSIWTHNLKGKQWTDNYVVKGVPNGTKGVPAVTLQPGEQWLGQSSEPPTLHAKPTDGIDVYRAASERNTIVVGGSARSVGAVGGWLLGGGHSAFSNLYGLGVDSKSRCYHDVDNLD